MLPYIPPWVEIQSQRPRGFIISKARTSLSTSEPDSIPMNKPTQGTNVLVISLPEEGLHCSAK